MLNAELIQIPRRRGAGDVKCMELTLKMINSYLKNFKRVFE
jgi:hypothetical protein